MIQGQLNRLFWMDINLFKLLTIKKKHPVVFSSLPLYDYVGCHWGDTRERVRVLCGNAATYVKADGCSPGFQ